MASSAALTTTHLPALRAALEEWRGKQSFSAVFATPTDDLTAKLAKDTTGDPQKDVIVAFRTRPPLENEAAEKFKSYEGKGDVPEGDAQAPPEFCAGITATKTEPGEFVAHVPGLKWSGPTLTHKAFQSDIAFGPDVPNDEVYQRTVIANDMIPLALSSGIACILAYGQTGTGKTYTMEALEHRMARDLFIAARHIGKKLLEAEKQARGKGNATDELDFKDPLDVFEFSVSFMELLGKRGSDLLEPVEGLPVDEHGNVVRKEVPIQEDKNGDVRPRLLSRTVSSAEELDQLITTTLSHRRVSATHRNTASSRSHAILSIRITNKLIPYAQQGQLLLVDLAGSERYEDSKGHDKQRMLESRDNNNSLMNLKECVRAKAKMASEDGFVHIPWRSSRLTMLLKPIFDPESRQPSKTLIIAHVSPHIQDTVHSVNTLSYASPFKMSPPKPRGPAPYDPTDPRTWDHAQTVSWFTNEFTKRAKARQKAARAVQEQEAAAKGKKIAPLNPNAPVELGVDVAKLCPPGMTARNFGAMYTVEFLQRCLESANITTEMTPAVIRNMATEVSTRLYYLILTAKTRKRREIMKSRKVLEVDSTYGDTPYDAIPGTDIPLPEQSGPLWQHYTKYTPEQYLKTISQRGGTFWSEVNLGGLFAREAGDDANTAKQRVIFKMMEEDWGSSAQALETSLT